ncbi:MAG: DNA ligase [Alphaproteobacteria bacterium]|nr:DNA ligase [Alphaproteobacteria bacterium]
MSDEEFDALATKEGYERVGYNPDAKRKHLFPLYSLQKVFEGEDTPPTYKSNVIETPKLDGAAIAIQYKKGKLSRVVTRGDGIAGVDITDKFMFTDIVPKQLWTKLQFKEFDNLQITGEIVAPKEIPNARNYAAGALNLKDVNEFRNRNLTFIAYSVEPSISPFYKTDMSSLLYEGFNVATCDQSNNWNEYPNDGKVIRVNDNKEYSDLGYTSHHPRGAYALKTREEGIETTLLDVVWQTGKSGKVTPVAILDPIEIDDAIISRATLNNMAYIKSLNLEIGCRVKVIRAGKIIPRIIERVSSNIEKNNT